MKARSTKAAARKRPVTCPVAILAVEANELICVDTEIEDRAAKGKAEEYDHILGLHITDRLEAIKQQASYTPAQSLIGAAFQIMLASSEAEQLIEDDDVEEQKRIKRRADRLVRLAIDCLRRHDPDVGSLYMARMQYLTQDVRGEVANAVAAARVTMHGPGRGRGQ